MNFAKTVAAVAVLCLATQSSALTYYANGTVFDGGAWDGAIIFDGGVAATVAQQGSAPGLIVGTTFSGPVEPQIAANPGIGDLIESGGAGWEGPIGDGHPVAREHYFCSDLPGSVCVTGKREMTVDYTMSYKPNALILSLIRQGEWELPTWTTYHSRSGYQFGIWTPEDAKPHDKAACVATCNTAQAMANDQADITAAQMLGQGEITSIVAGVGTMLIISARSTIAYGALVGFGVYEVGKGMTKDWVAQYIATSRALAAKEHLICLHNVCKV